MKKHTDNKAAISTVVALSISFFIIVLTGITVSTSSLRKNSLDNNKKIKNSYENDVNRIEEVYNEVLSLEQTFIKIDVDEYDEEEERQEEYKNEIKNLEEWQIPEEQRKENYSDNYELGEASWANISEIARLISLAYPKVDSDTNKVSVTINNVKYTLHVGDYIMCNALNNDTTEYKLRIMGFNHDELVDPLCYGDGKEHLYAGISFEFVTKVVDSMSMCGWPGTNSGGWAKTNVRSELNGNFYNNKFKYKNIVKQVKKPYLATYNNDTISYSNDYFWLTSCAEIYSNGRTTGVAGLAYANEGHLYKLYKNSNVPYNTISNFAKKPINNSSDYYWLRSCAYNTSDSFLVVNYGSVCEKWDASWGVKVYPCFCI